MEKSSFLVLNIFRLLMLFLSLLSPTAHYNYMQFANYANQVMDSQ